METKVYNLIIVDKSGSMSGVTHATIAGVNETIGCIKAAAKQNPEQKQFITLVVFCGCEQRYIFDNVSLDDARVITEKDYQPCCHTPLYDTIGKACMSLEKTVGDDSHSLVSVTILTDGYENASKEFSHSSIVALINRLKKKGWMFAYVGADHDVESVAFSLSIDNVMEFQKNEADMKRMFDDNVHARMDFCREFSACSKHAMSNEQILAYKQRLAKNYYRKRTTNNGADDTTNTDTADNNKYNLTTYL